MGESKRRKSIDPNYGRSAFSTRKSGNIGSAPSLGWRVSGVCDADGIVANNPALAREASWLMLRELDGRIFPMLPPMNVAVSDAARHVARLFPGLAFVTASPSRFRETVKAEFGATADQFDDYLFQHPTPTDPRRVLVMRSSDEDGQYIPIGNLVHGLGYYVVSVAGNLRAGVSSTLVGVPGWSGAASLLYTLPYFGARVSHPNELPRDAILQVSAYFVGYALCHYLGLDPRSLSHLLLSDEHRHTHFKGLIAGFIGDLLWLVGHAGALESFLDKKVAVSREEWQTADSEQFRIAVVSRATDELLTYQAVVDSTGRPDGGASWLPKESDPPPPHTSPGLLENLQPLVQESYEHIIEGARALILAGHELPTTLTPLLVTHGDGFETGEIFIQGMTSENEESFIGRYLGNPRCLFVIRTSEAWALPNTPAGLEETARVQRGEIKLGESPHRVEVVAVRFISHHFSAAAACPIRRPSNTVESVPLRFEPSR